MLILQVVPENDNAYGFPWEWKREDRSGLARTASFHDCWMELSGNKNQIRKIRQKKSKKLLISVIYYYIYGYPTEGGDSYAD